ncbi:PDR/VanB family oxidoreductase [Mycolicibacterium goodii]|uniref:Ferredoxin n=1 Tax=Mycolicibacterium goodii TaxID=134601 RepID=A0A0K0X7N6_MYCGD|nr:ferredoxin [Mycolicibacterium goodii]
MQLTVTEIDDSVPGVRTLRLAHPDGRSLPSYPPGSHVVVRCGEVANAYSLTGDGVCPMRYVISVLLCPNGSGGSRWVHDELRIGETIEVSEPRSAFAPIHRARRHLLVAAGIGITPMMSHLYSAKRWDRDARLLYIHRAGRGAYLGEIEQLGIPARICTDRAKFGSELTAALIGQPIGTHLYVCGPGPFMDDVIAQAGELGWPDSRIHSERFGVDTLDAGEPFEVELARTGQTLTVASGVSLLETLERHGHSVPNLCRRGVCGECRIPVAAGDILHRDLYLTDTEKQAGDALMACVSRAAGERLELSL